MLTRWTLAKPCATICLNDAKGGNERESDFQNTAVSSDYAAYDYRGSVQTVLRDFWNGAISLSVRNSSDCRGNGSSAWGADHNWPWYSLPRVAHQPIRYSTCSDVPRGIAGEHQRHTQSNMSNRGGKH